MNNANLVGRRLLSTVSAAALMLVLSTAASADDESQASDVVAEANSGTSTAPLSDEVVATLQAFEIVTRPSGNLDNEELHVRIGKLETVIGQSDLTEETLAQLQPVLDSDRAELALREQAAVAVEEPVVEAEASAGDDGETVAVDVDEAGEPLVPEAVLILPEATDETTVAVSADDTNEPAAVEVEATEVDAIEVESTEVEATAVGEQPAVEDGETKDAETDLATDDSVEVVAPDEPATVEVPPVAEADVEAAPQVSPEAETAAALLLADETPAEDLSDKELRARVKSYRDLLAAPELTHETSDLLRSRLKEDRQALRARVATEQAAELETAAVAPLAASVTESVADDTVQATTDLVDNADDNNRLTAALVGGGVALAAIAALPLLLDPAAAEIPQITADSRQPQQLNDAELGRRITALQDAVDDTQSYSSAQRAAYADQLVIDRQELQYRLVDAREQRDLAYQDYGTFDMPINFVAPQDSFEPVIWAAEVDDAQIWRQLLAAPIIQVDRQYARNDVMNNIEWIVTQPDVRAALPSVELDTITFGFNEDFVREEEVYDLDRIARLIEQVVIAHPDEIFLIEGHTDAVGSDAYNWRLSQRRAEAVKDVITRYYLVPPENLATAGLGEAYLKIWTPGPEEENRRVTVRRITPLVDGYAYQ